MDVHPFFKKPSFPTYLLIIFFVLTSALVSFTSSWFGQGFDTIQREERLLFFDSLEKKQPNTAFARFQYFDDSDNPYSEYLSKQNSMSLRQSQGMATVVAGGDSPLYFSYVHDEKEFFSNGKIATVNTFSDTEVMECIPLPLYKRLGFVMRSSSEDVFCCYISSAQADLIISSFPGEYTKYDDFYNKPFTFTAASHDHAVSCKFVVVNIYLNEQIDLWPAQKTKSLSSYSDFMDRFYAFNFGTIFTYSPKLFGQTGSFFEAEIRNGYGYARNFLRDIVGYDYAKNGSHLKVFLEASAENQLQEVTDSLDFDQFCKSTQDVTHISIFAILLLLLSLPFQALSCFWLVCRAINAKSFFISFLASLVITFSPTFLTELFYRTAIVFAPSSLFPYLLINYCVFIVLLALAIGENIYIYLRILKKRKGMGVHV